MVDEGCLMGMLAEGSMSGDPPLFVGFWGAAEIGIFRSPYGRMRWQKISLVQSCISQVPMSHFPPSQFRKRGCREFCRARKRASIEVPSHVAARSGSNSGQVPVY